MDALADTHLPVMAIVITQTHWAELTHFLYLNKTLKTFYYTLISNRFYSVLSKYPAMFTLI